MKVLGTGVIMAVFAILIILMSYLQLTIYGGVWGIEPTDMKSVSFGACILIYVLTSIMFGLVSGAYILVRDILTDIWS